MHKEIFNSKDIDPIKWDKFIRNSEQGSVYALYDSLDVLTKDWKALQFFHDNELIAVFPFHHQHKYLLKYSYPPMFTQYLGVISTASIDKDTLKWVHTECASWMKSNYIKVVHAFPPKSNELEKWIAKGFVKEERRTHLLSLDRSIEEIESSFSQNIKRNIRKATKVYSQVESLDQVDSAIELFKVEIGANLEEIQSGHYSSYQKWVSGLMSKQNAIVLALKNTAGLLVAAKVFIIYNDRMIYSMGAVKASERKSGASPMIMSEAIKIAKRRGLQIFDFEGSMQEGIARYFKSFGTTVHHFSIVKINRLPFLS